MKTPQRVSPSKVVAKLSAGLGQACEQRRTSPRKKAPEKQHPHEPAASESTEPTKEPTKVKCCGEEFAADDKRARCKHRKRFPKCLEFKI